MRVLLAELELVLRREAVALDLQEPVDLSIEACGASHTADDPPEQCGNDQRRQRDPSDQCDDGERLHFVLSVPRTQSLAPSERAGGRAPKYHGAVSRHGAEPRTDGDQGLPVADETIRIAQSCAHDPGEAVAELYDGLVQPRMSLVLFFCSSRYERETLAKEMAGRFAGVPVVGCTTAGEIGPAGCREHSLAGVSFASTVCTPVIGRLEGLGGFRSPDGVAVAQDLRRRLGDLTGGVEQNTFAFLLVDGLFGHEEQVAHALQQGLGDIPLVGGSAGDSLDFEGTYIYWDGRFTRDAAVLVLAATPLPLAEFKTQHFTATDERLVVTEADPGRRVVKEINGLPAAEEYARLLGVDPAGLGPARFAASPVVILVDGAEYVRSIQRVEPGGGLRFYCAIDRGVVLRIARGVDLVENLEEALARVRTQVGPPQLVLTFDCILRKLEIDQSGLKDTVSEVLRRHNAVGFNTYGEQFCGVHVNQTLTAIAFGRGPDDGGPGFA